MSLSILKAMCKKNIYTALHKKVPVGVLTQDVQNFISWISLYYKTYPTHSTIVWDSFEQMLKIRASNLTKEQLDIILLTEKRIRAVPEPDVDSVIELLSEQALAGESAVLIQRYQAGEEVSLAADLRALNDKYSAIRSVSSDLLKWEDSTISELLEKMDEAGGLKINFIPQFKKQVRGFLGGDLVVIAAPPDAGKTSFLACLAVDFAKQIKNGHILWLVNESLASRSKVRVLTAATGLTYKELVQAEKKQQLSKKYLDVVGDWDKIRLKDAHTMTMFDIHELVKATSPTVVIVDMLANIKGALGNSEHQDIEKKSQFLREMACENNCIVIGTMQISVEGYNLLYPPLHALKQSKTGVQGAVDLCIFLGRIDGNESIRGISTPKNKLRLSDSNIGYLRVETEFDSVRCKFN